MHVSRRKTGLLGEEWAAAHLRALGYDIIECNYRRAGGEIDIVAHDGERLAFVEVRTRRGTKFGTPEESLTPRKQARLVNTARMYLQEHACGDVSWGIDLLAIALDENGAVERVNLIRNAVWDQ